MSVLVLGGDIEMTAITIIVIKSSSVKTCFSKKGWPFSLLPVVFVAFTHCDFKQYLCLHVVEVLLFYFSSLSIFFFTSSFIILYLSSYTRRRLSKALVFLIVPYVSSYR